ncbi:MAG: Ig-like domain-containing protein [Methanobacterium sp.]|uniref:Ig-like domain-containing protein n=2 Tax=Methanobacterium sp. TaxID=2164 RepID=UPI003D906C07
MSSAAELQVNPGESIQNATNLTSENDTIKPQITGMDPVHNAVNVPRDKVITVTFNEPIKAGSNWFELKSSNGTNIPITTSIKDNKLIISPSTLLAPGTKYTVILHTDSVSDSVGNSLALIGKCFTTTTDTVGPQVIGIDPVHNAVNVPRDKVITVTFNEPIKAGSNWFELKSSNGTNIPITTSIKDNKLIISPSTLLAPGTKYTVILHTDSVSDSVGNSLALIGKCFTTTTDTVGPQVIGIDPVHNAVNVPRDKVITVTFNEPIKAGSNWFELKSSNGTNIPITTSIKDNKLIISPSTLLAPGQVKYLHTVVSDCW